MRYLVIFLMFLAVGLFEQIKLINHERPHQDENIVLYRRIVTQQNVMKINHHNNNPEATYKLAAYPRFISLTQLELAKLYLIKDDKTSPLISHQKIKKKIPDTNLVNQFIKLQVDLTRIFANITPVYNQGICKNSYAIAATDSVNYLNLRMKINAPPLSFQQLTDCNMGHYNNNGCESGNSFVFNYMSINGLLSLKDYPQTQASIVYGTISNANCKPSFLNKYKSFKIRDYIAITTFDCKDYLSLIIKGFAISVIINMNDFNFYFYQSGVLPQCLFGLDLNADYFSYALLVGVKIDQKNNNYFWKVKNSWGVDWGEQGYIRIDIRGNSCGLCRTGVYPVL